MPDKTADEIHRALSDLIPKNTPTFRILRCAWSSRLKDTPGRSLIAIARSLVPLGQWERGFAYELIAHHRGAREALRPGDVIAFGCGIDSWGAVDGFACFVSGPAWRENKIPTSLVRSWARSPSRWWRRAALVSTVPLNNRARGGKGDARRTLSICRMLARDRDDMVVKSLSWALRELSKRDRLSVELFLKEHEKILAARVNREVRQKLETGLKNPRRGSRT
jgi:hypothetical protein